VNCFFIFGVSPFVYRILLKHLSFFSEEGVNAGNRWEELAILKLTVADAVKLLYTFGLHFKYLFTDISSTQHFNT
jgi:hypothetical protein